MIGAAPSSRYQVLGHLARGGMGEILLARRIGPAGFEKLVVLKRPLDTSLGSRSLVAALIEEARLLAQINHPNVCQVHDLEEADGQFFLALEYLEGLSLWSILAAQRPIEPRVLCGVFEQACEGLDAIHALRGRDGEPLGVVHRDISPGNLFLTEAGTVKILDLGIAKSTDSEEHTPFGRVKGKLSYISPEQARGKPIDARSDLFSLGLVLYDMVRGQKPARDRIGALAIDSLELDSVPPAIAPVITRALAVDPAQRYASAREMASALRDVGAALGGSSTRAELGDWLVREFATELANRRALRRTFTDGDVAQPATTARTLTLRSVIASLDVEADVVTRLPVRNTEQLSVPAAERLHPPQPVTGTELIGMEVIPGNVPPRRTSARYAIGAVVLAGCAIAAIVFATREPSTSDSPIDVVAVKPSAVVSDPATTQPPAPETPTLEAPPEAATPRPPAIEPKAASPAPTPGPPEPIDEPPAPPPKRVARVEKPAMGTLTVHSNPYAMIRIGPKHLGATTLWRVPMKAGRYTLHATASDGRVLDRPITIAPGEETKVGLDWSKR